MDKNNAHVFNLGYSKRGAGFGWSLRHLLSKGIPWKKQAVGLA